MKESGSGSFLASSFTDLMASLAVIFILLTVVFIKTSSERSQKSKEVIQEGLAEVLDKNKLPLVQDPKDPLSLSVRVGENFLKFGLNSATVSPAGVSFLGGFIPGLVEQLCRDEILSKLDAIVIEGHTDRSGEGNAVGTNRNIRLSQERALSVLGQALISLHNNPDLHDCLLKIVSASGRGSSQPVFEQGEYQADLSRRVEIRIRAKSNEQL